MLESMGRYGAERWAFMVARGEGWGNHLDYEIGNSYSILSFVILSVSEESHALGYEILR